MAGSRLSNVRRTVIAALFLVLCAMGLSPAAARAEVASRSVLFVVDVSGSMTGAPLEQAKTALAESIKSLDQAVAAGLRTFAGGCGDSGRLLVPVAPGNRDALLSAADSLSAGGGTPTPDALRAAAADLPSGGERTIVLISDGQSTCGDPCTVAKELHDTGVSITMHTVGFNVSGAAETQLSCIADATGGKYFSATDTAGLSEAIRSATGFRQLRYVALGDSFSSGEGAGAHNYFQLNGKDVKCHRAPTAWSFVLAQASDEIADDMTNFACTGALTKHVLRKAFKGEPKQIDQLQTQNLREQVDLITITVSGNDAGFSGLVRECFTSDCAKDATSGKWREKAREAARVLASDIVPALQQAAPSARVVIVGYPRLLPEKKAEVMRCGWLKDAERKALNRLVKKVNGYLADAVYTELFENPSYKAPDIILPFDALDGHELCSADSHVVKIYGNPRNSEQSHPDIEGQKDYARAVQEGLVRLGVVSA